MQLTRTRSVLAVVLAAALTMALTLVAPTREADAQSIPGLVSGVDVANHQHPGRGPINWKSVGTLGGQDFAFVKATEGSDYVNPFYLEDAKAAREAGLEVGAYHYARPAGDPVAQARHFAETINSGPETSLPPVLDLEVEEGLSPTALIAWTRVFLLELERASGKKPMVYTYRYFWYERMSNTNAFTNYPLWLAAYQNQPPRPVGGWDKLSFWQRSDNGRVVGIDTPVDMNLYNGTKAQLGQFAAGNLNAGGGVLEKFQVQDSEELKVLEQDNTKLVAAILALAAGGFGAGQLIEAAKTAGFDPTDAKNITALVKMLAGEGELPVDDLRNMLLGNYQVGDLLILLDNAAKEAQG